MLHSKYDVDKQKFEAQINKYQKALGVLPELQEKIKQLDKLKKDMEQRDEEIVELKLRIDEGADSSNMIEIMTQELIKKEEDIIGKNFV